MEDRDLLIALADGPVSGDVLARAAGTTRAAIWKRIAGLRGAGVAISAQAGVGYALERPLDLLEAGAIGEALAPSARDELAGLEIAWSIDSTSSELLRRSSSLLVESIDHATSRPTNSSRADGANASRMASASSRSSGRSSE